MDVSMQQLKSITIVGGGFSGICTAIHLIERANFPIAITLIEKQPKLCRGIAYGTTSPHHPLNVRAGRMGALAKHPEHFYSWLETHSDQWRNFDPVFKFLKITPDSYLPRKLYAVYLQDLFHQARITAEKKKIMLKIIHDEAQDANVTKEGLIEICLGKGDTVCADHLVLAMGVPCHKFSFETSTLLNHPHYIGNFWDEKLESVLRHQCVKNLGKGKIVAIIGTGLTAIDALFTMYAMSYQGKILLISKKGTFPQVHTEELLPPYFHFKIEEYPNTISGLIKLFKCQLEQVNAAGLDWRQLIDGFRNHTQEIWRSLSLWAKKQFMRHLFSLWNKHRHRMSPRSFEVVETFKRNKALTLVSGTVQDVIILPNKRFEIEFHSAKTGSKERDEVDVVMNCSGPDYQIFRHTDPLIQAMLKKRIIIPDDIGLGVKVENDEQLAGKGRGKIYAVGALLFGERFETTAVPDLREQADSIAKTILNYLE
jgi:uncharacterized NAD(P)/FAD-binding protein YdhS